MAEWHLRELEHRLTQRGWKIGSEIRRGEADRWGLSGSWEIVRGDERLWLDFQGGDAGGLLTHPIEHAYGCYVRGESGRGLSFRRKRAAASRRAELEAFVASL